MSPVTHFLTGWAIANLVALDSKDRSLVTLACVIPDVDGLGIIPELLTRNSAHPLLWFSLYHHALHTLAFSIVVAIAAFFLSSHKWETATLVFFSFHIHLLEDLVGSRGPDGDHWPIRYLAPFSENMNLAWNHQWALNAWPNFVLTLALLLLMFYLAWDRGHSPLGIFSHKADATFVRALRERFARSDLC